MKFKCPLCQENNAKRSYAYPESIVCKCSGKLEEVGVFKDGQMNPLPNQHFKQEHNNEQLNPFTIKRLDDVNEIYEYGKEFNNALQDTRYTHNYLNAGCKIYTADYNNDKTHDRSVMFFIKDKQDQNYVLHNNAPAPQADVDIIKEYLRKNNLIN